MTLPSLAVTGSTGALGALVAQGLADRGIPQRLLARTPAKAPVLPGAEAVAFAYTNDEATREALAGVEVLFMVSAAESPDRLEQHFAFVGAAAAAGVGHVVYTSFYGAAPDAVFTLARDHWATERRIIDSGMTHTFLRDDFYLDLLPDYVGDDGVLRGPAGDGRVAAVARADIARVAIEVLTDPAAHAGRTYDLTGPEALTMSEVAGILTETTGHEVTYYDETLEEAYQSRKKWPAEQWEYDAWVSTYTAIAAGEMQPATDDVERITGRRPLSLREVVTGER